MFRSIQRLFSSTAHKGVLILPRTAVQCVLNMKDCIDTLELAFAEYANGTAVLPLRTPIRPPSGLALYMPAYLKNLNALACKIVSVYPNNPTKFNLPTTLGKILIQDPETGDVRCIMDGGYVTAVRTGAVSGLATKYLSVDKPNLVCTLIGAGVQGKQQLIAMATIRKLHSINIIDMNLQSAERLIYDPSKTSTALSESDILCTASSSPSPVFDGNMIKPGTHINGIGSHSPNARELDEVIVRRSALFVDSREACLSEAGDIMKPIADGIIDKNHMKGELGEVITKKVAGRENENDITIFKSNGLAIQDVATAKLVYNMALKKGVGSFVDI